MPKNILVVCLVSASRHAEGAKHLALSSFRASTVFDSPPLFLVRRGGKVPADLFFSLLLRPQNFFRSLIYSSIFTIWIENEGKEVTFGLIPQS